MGGCAPETLEIVVVLLVLDDFLDDFLDECFEMERCREMGLSCLPFGNDSVAMFGCSELAG